MGCQPTIVRAALAAGLAVLCLAGCAPRTPPYGEEERLTLRGPRVQVWAVAPAVNLSGQREVDPILQADLLFTQLQQVRGVTAIPVNRVAEVYANLRIDSVQSLEQAATICELLACDGLLVPTVTIYDPFNPPKMGASLQLFLRNAPPPPPADKRSRKQTAAAAPAGPALVQVTGLYDASNGSVRDAVAAYAAGRSEPAGPYGAREYFVSTDRYCSFVYHALLADMLKTPRFSAPR